MIASCIHVDGATLGTPERGLGYTDKTVFHVTPGSEYQVMGMSLYKAGLTMLICDDTKKPNWYPIGLFYIVDAALPTDWEFAIVDVKEASGSSPATGLAAEWGYRELIRNPSHSNDLIERKPEALEIFAKELAKQSGST